MVGSLRGLAALAVASAGVLVLGTGAFAWDRHASASELRPGAQSFGQARVATGCDVPGRSCDPSKTDHDNGVGNRCDPGWGRGNQAKQPKPDEVITGCRAKAASSEQESQTEETSKPSSPSQTEQMSQTSPSTGEVEATSAPCQETEDSTQSDRESKTAERHEAAEAETHDSGKAETEQECAASQKGEVEESSKATVTVTVEASPKTVTVTTTTAPAATAPSGAVLGATSTAGPAGTTAAAAPAARTAATTGVGGVLGAAATAAAGTPLAATGLPILAGLVGLALIGIGAAARRRGD